MERAIRVAAGLALALMFAGCAVIALAMTWLTVKDAAASDGSLTTFEAHIRHYSDRLEVVNGELTLHRVRHPFALHFGALVGAWIGTIGAGTLFSRRFLHPRPSDQFLNSQRT